jgi:ABC-type multidrug transport system fused ATPase/permease subunit
LRKGIAFIPQLPFLLQGTIRENIDPFHESEIDTIWRVLREVNLFDHIDKLEDKLETKVSEGSNLFSVG